MECPSPAAVHVRCLEVTCKEAGQRGCPEQGLESGIDEDAGWNFPRSKTWLQRKRASPGSPGVLLPSRNCVDPPVTAPLCCISLQGHWHNHTDVLRSSTLKQTKCPSRPAAPLPALPVHSTAERAARAASTTRPLQSAWHPPLPRCRSKAVPQRPGPWPRRKRWPLHYCPPPHPPNFLPRPPGDGSARPGTPPSLRCLSSSSTRPQSAGMPSI